MLVADCLASLWHHVIYQHYDDEAGQYISHYSVVVMDAMASRLFAQPLFRRGSKKTSKFRVTGLCEENSPVTTDWPVISPHKGPVTRKSFQSNAFLNDQFLQHIYHAISALWHQFVKRNMFCRLDFFSKIMFMSWTSRRFVPLRSVPQEIYELVRVWLSMLGFMIIPCILLWCCNTCIVQSTSF